MLELKDNAVLRHSCKPVIFKKKGKGRKLGRLVRQMFETMYAANGIGLAVPQVGVDLRLAVIDVSSGKEPAAKLVLANPEILFAEGREIQQEGCLSLPGVQVIKERPTFVRMRAFNQGGKEFTLEASGLLARVICHEVDHLNGILIDSAPTAAESR